jgi:hypothetical protein
MRGPGVEPENDRKHPGKLKFTYLFEDLKCSTLSLKL